ncbi:universal stress protein [Nocardioides sp. MH1]|uniref:universal stress protein n=1 Tax=Nocardioides sp. MH1 TaxID=3242490 RepID=UPI0035213B1A
MNNIQPGSIVVGADGSADARRAVQWAAEQAALERRPLVVFTAARQTPAMVGSWPGPAYVYPPDELLASAQDIADEASALASRHRPGIAVAASTATVEARSALIDLASDAHLLVLGSRGRGPVGSKVLGSVSAFVTRHAGCPVVVCRPGTDLRVKNGVLVGADGTAESLPVLDFAFRQASLRDQPLTVLHSFFDDLAVGDGADLARRDEPGLERQRLRVAETIAGFGERYPEVRVGVQVTHGIPADTVSAIADRHSLVVLGHHPTDSVARHLSSAVATAVLERTHTNVAVVPEAAAGSLSRARRGRG